MFNTVLEYGLIEEEDNIVLGLSGGPDSMALLYVLIEIKKKISFNLFLAHVNHGVRGDEALKDEEFVKMTAKRLKLPYFSTRVDMIGEAKKEGISAEEAGRKLRYGFFERILKKQGKGKIAVAHNKKDQAETLLMRIMRGTGIDGLKGMDFQTGNIIRPMLDIDRWEIEKYIEDKKIETVLDKTNLETIYTRNKVRLELIPYIEENFNPNIVDTLFRLSENAALDSKFLDEFTDNRYKKIVTKRDKEFITFKYESFKNEDIPIKRRIIRKAILDLTHTLQGIEDVHVTSIIELFYKKETGKMINLPNSIIAKVAYDDLIIEKVKKESTRENKNNNLLQDLKLGNNILDDYAIELDLDIIEKRDVDLKRTSPNKKYFDYDKIVGKISVRNRKDGDRFSPFGMRGTKKLKDYFIDEKIPRDLRDKIPLLVDENNIIWVIGYRASEIYKVDKDTTRVLKVHIKTIKF